MKRDRLYSPKVIKSILKEFDFNFSKGLGQNFLIDGNVVRTIRESAQVTKDDYVLEIGPGFGTLTEELLMHAKKVVAVEIDQRLVEVLNYTLKDFDNFVLINEDVLKVDFDRLVKEEFQGHSFKILANLPYYITTPIITKLIEMRLPVESMTFMVQKEVADRLVAKPGNKQYGSITVFIDYYSQAKIVCKAPKSVFIPQPKVDSAVVRLELKEPPVSVDEKTLFKLVHAGFQQRRKNILNSLTSDASLDLDKKALSLILDSLSIPHNLRAEDLSLQDFINISNKVNKK
ncbi:MAG: 16S rRNA (adenine(1518)-N(6)/adenine(1519)-N(6))-dimethyltransferase RsmA [Tissierellia bacterium]|nr:16S rRNA (adenine(1518)-N(6)/adenine(1519)-N(6))-dimethyltransferase RsmA [Tissierellia bacterium]